MDRLFIFFFAPKEKYYMRNLSLVILLMGALFANYGCSSVEKELIQGEWKGVSILENGKALDLDPSEIQLSFSPSNTYTYKSTLNYQEAGSYHLDKKYLYTTDTLNLASSKKTVEILLLSEDSLQFKMMEANQERILKLVKVN